MIVGGSHHERIRRGKPQYVIDSPRSTGPGAPFGCRVAHRFSGWAPVPDTVARRSLGEGRCSR